ncbi:mitochondral 37S ribosomal protein S27 [Mycoemilia scoparia]|uniref:Small ribosomal subunit protein mS33 n=1 Tax=Mycoemilia scoparia TaxID=417184 RepID=A0A9W8DTG6_9FUNG|nr:mitochondral 37S ribosomal protein S27 [Mycoemilia scoparia]
MSQGLAARKLKLAELTSKVFQHAFNPTNARTGRYIMRQNLAGEKIYSYYPRPELLSGLKFRKLDMAFPELELLNLDEEERLLKVEKLKRRGKGTPKKGEGRRAALGKKK